MFGVFAFGQAAFAEQGTRRPFGGGSFPNPQVAPRNSNLTNFFNAVELTLIGQDAMIAGQQRYPASIAPLALQPPGFVSVNLIMTLLATLPTPNYQHDWPLPQPLRYPQSHVDQLKLNLLSQDAMVVGQSNVPSFIPPLVQRQSHVQSVRLTLLGKDALPVGQTHAPLPVLAIQPPITQRTHIDPLKINLLSQDAMVTGQANLPPAIAPLARPYTFSYTYGLDLNLLGQDTMVVGRSNIPAAIPPLVPRQSHVDPLKLNLLGQDALAVGQSSIPPAIPPLVPRQAFTSTDFNLTLYATSLPPKPFAKTDWPNPIIPARGAGFADINFELRQTFFITASGNGFGYGVTGYDPRSFACYHLDDQPVVKEPLTETVLRSVSMARSRSSAVMQTKTTLSGKLTSGKISTVDFDPDKGCLT